MTTVFPPSPRPVAAVAGTDALFPVRRIFCVGQNYAAHAREMGSDPSRTEPVFFTKPGDAVVTGGDGVPYPPMTTNLHYEIEMVVAMGSGGADIAEADALSHVFGYAAGIDLTRRDLQAAAKKAGAPWDMAKGFDRSAPIGTIAPAGAIGHPAAGKAGRPMVLVGDLNIAPLEHDVWSHSQLLDVVSHTPVEVEKLAALQGTLGWIDAARVFVPPEKKLYSWWSYRAKDWRASGRGRRLDHIWITPALEGALKACTILGGVRGWEPKPSDHSPEIAELMP